MNKFKLEIQSYSGYRAQKCLIEQIYQRHLHITYYRYKIYNDNKLIFKTNIKSQVKLQLDLLNLQFDSKSKKTRDNYYDPYLEIPLKRKK